MSLIMHKGKIKDRHWTRPYFYLRGAIQKFVGTHYNACLEVEVRLPGLTSDTGFDPVLRHKRYSHENESCETETEGAQEVSLLKEETMRPGMTLLK